MLTYLTHFLIYVHNIFFQVENKQKKSESTLLENESHTTIYNLQCQIKELNAQLKQQSTLNFIIGSTFGNYLWKATQVPAVIDMVLQRVRVTVWVVLFFTNTSLSRCKNYSRIK